MLIGAEILTTAQMRAIESDAMARGDVTGLTLMERAGAAVAGQIRLRWPRPGRVTVLCGPGNNGGDGYVIARHLARAGWQVRVLGIDNTPGPDAAEMRRRWREIGPILPLTEKVLRRRGESSDVYVDAILGTGLTRPPDGEIADILAHMGASGGDRAYYRSRIVSVDGPSGLCLDSGSFPGRARKPGDDDLRVRLTVAFDSPKPGHLLERGPDCCGELVIADIGLERRRSTARFAPEGQGLDDQRSIRSREVLRSPSLTAAWPDYLVKDRRRPEIEPIKRARWLTKRETGVDHKFGHGHALVIAGGIGQGGAGRLAARAALRVGAGLVTICPPRSALIAHSGPPDALMRQPVDDASALADLLGDPRITAICIGPGNGRDRAAALLPALLAAQRPTVLDADALTALAEVGLDGLHASCVLTPHMGEFARLFPDLADRLRGPRLPDPVVYDDGDVAAIQERPHQAQHLHKVFAEQRGPAYSKVDAARDAAARSGAIILLKGPDTVIAAPPPRGSDDSGRWPGRATIHSAFDVPWLATAGSGDVLAGIIAGLLARGLPPFDAAATGVWLHAAAARRFGPGLIADDLPDQLPGVFGDLGR